MLRPQWKLNLYCANEEAELPSTIAHVGAKYHRKLLLSPHYVRLHELQVGLAAILTCDLGLVLCLFEPQFSHL